MLLTPIRNWRRYLNNTISASTKTRVPHGKSAVAVGSSLRETPVLSSFDGLSVGKLPATKH